MFKEFLRSVAPLTLVLIVLVVLAVIFPLSPKQKVMVELHRGQSLREFASELEKKGVVRSSQVFLLLLRILGKDREVPSGIYIFTTHRSEVLALLEMIMQKPYPILVRVSIKPGLRIYDVARILSEHTELSVDSAKFVEVCLDTSFIEELAKKYPKLEGIYSLEGFLYPDTYLIDERSDEESIVELMVDNFFRKWNEYQLDTLLERSKLNFYDVVKLASIVEKEAVFDDEKPIIASVFLNRLERGMKLQANPTLWYVMNRSAYWLTYKDLKLETPYNTYMYRGLPPTPICSPDISSIVSVLKPANTNFLYFVADGKGRHIFSRTYREHLYNVRRMKRKWKSQAGKR